MNAKNDKSFWNNIKYWMEKIQLRVRHRGALETWKHNKSKKPIVANNKCCLVLLWSTLHTKCTPHLHKWNKNMLHFSFIVTNTFGNCKLGTILSYHYHRKIYVFIWTIVSMHKWGKALINQRGIHSTRFSF